MENHINPFEKYMKRPPRRKLVVIHEDLNFFWDERELMEIKEMWEKGFSLSYMTEYFKERNPEDENQTADEIFQALFWLSRQRKIFLRKGALMGWMK